MKIHSGQTTLLYGRNELARSQTCPVVTFLGEDVITYATVDNPLFSIITIPISPYWFGDGDDRFSGVSGLDGPDKGATLAPGALSRFLILFWRFRPRPGLVDELAERFSPRGDVLDLDAYRSLRRGPYQQQFIPAKLLSYMAGNEFMVLSPQALKAPEDAVHNIAVIS
jgi:hypothetical protein